MLSQFYWVQSIDKFNCFNIKFACNPYSFSSLYHHVTCTCQLGLLFWIVSCILNDGPGMFGSSCLYRFPFLSRPDLIMGRMCFSLSCPLNSNVFWKYSKLVSKTNKELSGKRFCESISHLINTRDMENLYSLFTDFFSNKWRSNSKVLCPRIEDGVRSKRYRPLIINQYHRWCILENLKLLKKISDPHYFTRVIGIAHVFSLHARSWNRGLFLGAPWNEILA